MEFIRKIGIAIVMIVPGFVFGGLVWDWFGSWPAVLGLEIVMIIIYFLIISGKFSGASQKA